MKDDFCSSGTFHTIISREIYQVHLVPWQTLLDCKLLPYVLFSLNLIYVSSYIQFLKEELFLIGVGWGLI